MKRWCQRRRTPLGPVGCLAAAFALAAWLPHPAAAESLEVHELESQLAKYDGRQLTVVGRFKSANAQRMLLVDSQIEFRLSKTAGRVRSSFKNVEVTGRLSQDGKQWTLAVEHVAAAPGEAETFADRRKAILPGDYRRLYDLCAWLRSRAGWYHDDVLVRLAAEHYRQAFAWEEEALAKADDPSRLLDLAARGAQLGLEAAECDRIRHRALWIRLRQTPSDAEPELRRLAMEIAATWPRAADAGTAWTAEEEAVVATYMVDPLASYAQADAQRRPLLQRALWVEVMGRALEAAARSDAARLAELALEAEKSLPERPDWNRRLRLQEARRLARTPQDLTRGKAVALHHELTSLGQPDEAKRLLSQWLGQARRKLNADDAEGHAQLAANYLELLDDNDTAAQLYQLALRAAPEFAEAQAALQMLGYRRVAGAWQKAVKSTDDEADSRQPEPRGVQPGDTEQEVVRRLRQPDRITRTLSAGYLSELWIYDGPPRLYIYLKRGPGSATARVVTLAAP